MATLAAGSTLAPRATLAEDAAPPATRAEQLFQDGKQRLARDDYAEACPLLAESYTLDPASGTLLALAVCYERAGKLASAHTTYREVEARSRLEQRSDREQASRAQAEVLAPKLSTLTITSAAKAAELEVRLDGVVVDLARLDVALAVDGGEHVVEASAPNCEPWSTRVTVAASADAQRVTIPELGPQAPPAEAPSLADHVQGKHVASGSLGRPLPPASPPRSARSRGPSAEQWLGLGIMSAGGVALGTGVVFAILAGGEDRSPATSCGSEGCIYRRTETSDGDRAALAFVVGGSLAVTGLAIYLVTAPVSSSSDSARAERTLAGGAWVSPRSAGATVRGRF
jgi:hypothetical protein